MKLLSVLKENKKVIVIASILAILITLLFSIYLNKDVFWPFLLVCAIATALATHLVAHFFDDSGTKEFSLWELYLIIGWAVILSYVGSGFIRLIVHVIN